MDAGSGRSRGVGRAVALDGSSGSINGVAQTNPQTFSVQIWFRTATAGQTGGGRLIGFGNGTGRTTSSQYDRHLRGTDPEVMPGHFERADLTPRERLLAVFDLPAATPLCPYVGAAVELHAFATAAAIAAVLVDSAIPSDWFHTSLDVRTGVL